MAWCLTKQASENFKKALKSGEINPFKMAEMDSPSRRKFISKYVGEENAKEVNALFESKLLLKHKKRGYITWAKQVSGISPRAKRDILSRIEKMDRVLDPKEEEQFLQDLASTRLRIDVTQEEAKNIMDLSNKLTELKGKADEDGKFSNQDDRMAYGMGKVAIEKYINELKLEANKIYFKDQPVRKVVNAIKESPGAMKSMVASLDNSLWGRQGIKVLADTRTSKIWFKNFLKSWGDIGRELVGIDAIDMIKADIYSRPNALNGKYDAGNYGLLVLSEEAFPSSLPEKIPLLGRLFKASESAYNGGALRLRADLADRLIARAEKHGINTLNKDEAMGLGRLVTSMTGRGSMHMTPAQAKATNVLLFSIKFMKSNIDTLTAHQFDPKATKFAKSEARKNLLSMLATYSAIMLIAHTLDDESVDLEPRSTNFGRLKIFGKWVDITGGMASMIRLGAYIVPKYHDGKWSLWKKSSTGKWTDLRSGEFGGTDAFDTLIDGFFTNKLSPVAGLVRDALRGEMFGGEPFTTEGAIKQVTIPLSVQTYNDLKEDPQASFLLGSMILEGLGLSTSSYTYKAHWEKSTSKEMKQFKEKVGQKKFEQANNDYNRAYGVWYDSVTNSDRFKKLSEDAQSKLISKGKKDIKEKIFEEYGFKYETPEKTKKQKQEDEEIKKLLP